MQFYRVLYYISDARQRLLMKALEGAPPKSYLEALSSFIKWMEGVENLLESEPLKFNSIKVMSENLEPYKVRLVTLVV